MENLTHEKQEGSYTGNLNAKNQNEREEILHNILGKYRNHPSIVNMIQTGQCSTFLRLSHQILSKLLKN